MKLNINLIDALTGTEFVINKLNGENKLIKTDANTIINPQNNIKVPKLGMPIHNTDNYGDLYIEVNIIFPNQLSEKRQEYLKKILPKESSTSKSIGEYEKVPYNIIKKEGINFDPPPKKKETNEREGVECAQQ
jgi:DnaJ-class molecular chaperone